MTGGAGFIGSHVADRLAADGHEPVVLDALIPQAHGGEKPSWVGELLHADIRDADALRAALRGIDSVCHQAAMVSHGVLVGDARLCAGRKRARSADLRPPHFRVVAVLAWWTVLVATLDDLVIGARRGTGALPGHGRLGS